LTGIELNQNLDLDLRSQEGIMRKVSLLVLFPALLSLLFVPAALAQRGMNGRDNVGCGRQNYGQRIYNPGSVETVSGEVIGIDNPTSVGGRSAGVHVQLETADAIIPVHLGPAWYLDHQAVVITQGDQIEVTGSRVTLAGEVVIVAAAVRKGDQVLILRDQAGIPVWSGWSR
jgi:hypothetical protein